MENSLVLALTQLLLTVPVMVINGRYFKVGFRTLWHRSPNMDSLIAVGSGAALVYSIAVMFQISLGKTGDHLYFESAAMVLTLVTVGKLLEEKSKGKTTNAIKSLIAFFRSFT